MRLKTLSLTLSQKGEGNPCGRGNISEADSVWLIADVAMVGNFLVWEDTNEQV